MQRHAVQIFQTWKMLKYAFNSPLYPRKMHGNTDRPVRYEEESNVGCVTSPLIDHQTKSLDGRVGHGL